MPRFVCLEKQCGRCSEAGDEERCSQAVGEGEEAGRHCCDMVAWRDGVEESVGGCFDGERSLELESSNKSDVRGLCGHVGERLEDIRWSNHRCNTKQNGAMGFQGIKDMFLPLHCMQRSTYILHSPQP